MFVKNRRFNDGLLEKLISFVLGGISLCFSAFILSFAYGCVLISFLQVNEGGTLKPIKGQLYAPMQYVSAVLENGPAKEGGLRLYDRIMEMLVLRRRDIVVLF